MQLFFRETGKGEPLIILHGVFGSSDNWLTIAKILGENFRVILLDQRNHGQSPQSENHNYQAMADDLLEFLDTHQIQKANIIGHSMGGKTAMQFAVQHPERVKKMIVVDIAPKQYLVHHGKILRGLNAIDLATLPTRQEADRILAEYEPDSSTRQFLLKNLYRTENSKFAWRMNLPTLTREIGNVVAPLQSNQPVMVNTLFMKGAKSWYITTEDEAKIKDIFPLATFVSIPDAGHWIQAEQPEKFVEATRSFLFEA
jgi:pimeloyl-ACP methyl ester carboxylesterase